MEREKGVAELAKQIPPIVDSRVKANEDIEQKIEKSIQEISERLTTESKLSKETNDELLEQIEHYTSRLKNCVKML